MIKLLFFVVNLLVQDPHTQEISLQTQVTQITEGTCDDAKRKETDYLNENHAALGVVQAMFDCQIIEVDPSKNQGGSI